MSGNFAPDCEIIDGRPSGINKLTSHTRDMVMPLTEHKSKELFHQYCRPGRLLSSQSGEYETVRLATPTLLDTLDPNGPSDASQCRTSVRHAAGLEWFDARRTCCVSTVTPLTQQVQMRTLCPHITLHSFLVPRLWLKVNLIVCTKK